MTRLPLGLRAWATVIGRDKLRRVLAAADINALHFRGMANYGRTCTPASFERIERAALQLGVGVLPDYDTCTRPSVRAAAAAAQSDGRSAAALVEEALARQRAERRARLTAQE